MNIWHWVAIISGVIALYMTADQLHGDHWADHVMRRVESDPEFRERLRAALGVTP